VLDLEHASAKILLIDRATELAEDEESAKVG